MKRFSRISILLSIVVFAAIFCGPICSHAEWIEAQIVNSGAEAGDLSGWVNEGHGFLAVYDPNEAHQGDYYFSSNLGSPYDFVYSTLSADVDLTPFIGDLLDAYVSVESICDQKMITGYDFQTRDSYQYSWTPILQTNLYSHSGHELGLGGTIQFSPVWSTYGFNLKQHWKWSEVNENLTRLNIMLKYMLHSTDPNAPAARNIEEWYNWGVGIPEYSGFDTVEVRLEIVPVPAAALLLGSGLLCLIGFRKRNKS